MAHEIFISYRRKDSEYIAPQIYDRLNAEVEDPDAVFMDVDNIPFGFDFRDVLNDALAACEVVLAIIGPAWAERLHEPNDFVRLELEAALERDIPIIRVFVKGLRSVPREELPDSLDGLAYRQGLPLRTGRDRMGDLSRITQATADARARYRSKTHPAPDPSELYQKGKELFDAERYEEAVGPIQEAAEAGSAEAQNVLGWMYDMGKGLKQDQEEAVRWYRKAVAQGHASAQFNLGVSYANGRGVEADEEEAVRWYRKAAEQGHARAQCLLGVEYVLGPGVEADAKIALRWFLKSAERGDANAQSFVGAAYLFDRGDRSEEHDKDLPVNLTEIQSFVDGVEANYEEGARWLLKAANQGEAFAQWSLGWMYDNGRGVEVDQEEAVRWYEKAAAQGYADARAELDALKGNKS